MRRKNDKQDIRMTNTIIQIRTDKYSDNEKELKQILREIHKLQERYSRIAEINMNLEESGIDLKLLEGLK